MRCSPRTCGRRQSPGLAPRCLLSALATVVPSLAAAQTPDRIELVNGASLEGEIKSAVRGEVSFDNDEIGVFSVDVEDIVALVSVRFFEVRDARRNVSRGFLEAAAPGEVRVSGQGTASILDISDIVEITALEDRLWDRTRGHFDLGATFARANSLFSLTLGSLLAYRGRDWGGHAGLDGYWQGQRTVGQGGVTFEEFVRRLTATTGLERYFAQWTARGILTWETNDALELESRVQMEVGGLYSFVRGSRADFRAGGGLSSNTESYVGQASSTSLEGVVGVGLDAFDLGAVDIRTALITYINLNRDRYRARFYGRIAWELVSDFSVNFSFEENLDSRPPVVGAPQRDFRYGLSVGWSWS